MGVGGPRSAAVSRPYAEMVECGIKGSVVSACAAADVVDHEGARKVGLDFRLEVNALVAMVFLGPCPLCKAGAACGTAEAETWLFMIDGECCDILSRMTAGVVVSWVVRLSLGSGFITDDAELVMADFCIIWVVKASAAANGRGSRAVEVLGVVLIRAARGL